MKALGLILVAFLICGACTTSSSGVPVGGVPLDRYGGPRMSAPPDLDRADAGAYVMRCGGHKDCSA